MDPLQRIQLRIVPIASIHPHEIADPARETRIERRLREDGLLRDPLMAGTVPDFEGSVLLDGTNRRRALAALGLERALVQVIDYADEHAVDLRTWCHETSVPLDAILTGAREIPDLTVVPLPSLAAADALRSATTLAVILSRKDQFVLSRSVESSVSRADQLKRLIDLYEENMVRVDSTPDDIEERSQTRHHSDSADPVLIAFPPFNRSHVVTMAMRGTLIPAGITRHIIHTGRALRVNVPLELLRGDLSLDRAHADLKSHLSRLQPRLYREPTILFDS